MTKHYMVGVRVRIKYGTLDINGYPDRLRGFVGVVESVFSMTQAGFNCAVRLECDMDTFRELTTYSVQEEDVDWDGKGCKIEACLENLERLPLSEEDEALAHEWNDPEQFRPCPHCGKAVSYSYEVDDYFHLDGVSKCFLVTTLSELRAANQARDEKTARSDAVELLIKGLNACRAAGVMVRSGLLVSDRIVDEAVERVQREEYLGGPSFGVYVRGQSCNDWTPVEGTRTGEGSRSQEVLRLFWEGVSEVEIQGHVVSEDVSEKEKSES